MAYKNLILGLALLFTLSSCDKDDDDNSTPNNTDNVGSYTLEVVGADNYTIKGNAVMGQPFGDTLLAVGLEKKTSTPSGVTSTITLNISDSDGIYKDQDLPVEAEIPATPYVQVVGSINNEPLVGLSGTVNITDARRKDFINASYSFTAEHGSGNDIDTVQCSGSFEAIDPNS